jgi:hypothetical protein
MSDERTFYKYEVHWYNDFESYEATTSSGLVSAINYCDAVAQVEEAFDNIDSIAIHSINDGALLSFEELLDFLNPIKSEEASELIVALQEAIEVAKEGNL